MQDTTIITLPQPATTIVAVLLCIIVLSLFVVLILPGPASGKPGAVLKRARQLTGMPLESGVGVFIVSLLGLTYLALFLTALVVTGHLFWSILSGTEPNEPGTTPSASLGLGALLVALLGAPFLIWRSVVAQKTLDTTQHGQVTDRINAAVQGLGAEKEINRIGRSIQYRVGELWHTEFEWQDDRTELPDDAVLRKDDRPGEWQSVAQTVPNMEVRIGAILALGRIARENLDFHVQVMQILCAYVRENAPTSSAHPFDAPELPVNDTDEELTAEAIKTYLADLKTRLTSFRESVPPPRTDIQAALETLGRRTEDQKLREGAWPDAEGKTPSIFDTAFPELPDYPDDPDAVALDIWRTRLQAFRKLAMELRGEFRSTHQHRHDLRSTNLQGYDLSGLDLKGANLGGAQLQGAILIEAQLQGADLRGAQLQGANLFRARLQGANLILARLQGANLGEARLQGANLGGALLQGANLGDARLQGAHLEEARLQGATLVRARLQGADLFRAQLSADTSLNNASLRGASVREVDDKTLATFQPHWPNIFFAAETLPEGAPAHWIRIADDGLDYATFLTQWRAFAASLDPPVTIAPDYRE